MPILLRVWNIAPWVTSSNLLWCPKKPLVWPYNLFVLVVRKLWGQWLRRWISFLVGSLAWYEKEKAGSHATELWYSVHVAHRRMWTGIYKYDWLMCPKFAWWINYAWSSLWYLQFPNQIFLLPRRPHGTLLISVSLCACVVFHIERPRTHQVQAWTWNYLLTRPQY